MSTARKIVITSGKGGVGKTTIALLLSARLAERGERVLLCDGDFGLNNVDVCARVEHLITYDIVDVIEGRCRAKQALVKHPDFGNLYILASNHTSPERYISPQAVKVVLDGLSSQFDFIFLDCPAGLDDGFHRAVACADEAIVITTPHPSALRDADRAIALLKSYHLKELSIVINRYRGDLLTSGECLSPKEISNLLKTPILGLLPEDYDIGEGELSYIHPAVRMLASNLITDKRKLYDVTKKYRGLWGSIKRVLRKRL